VKEVKVTEAAGGLLFRESRHGKQLAIVHRNRYDDWALPKGRREKKETFTETALREVEEETCCKVVLGNFAGCTCYVVDGDPKVVLFWEMELVREKKFKPNSETDQLRWLSIDQALGTLDYEGERDLVKRALFEK